MNLRNMIRKDILTLEEYLLIRAAMKNRDSLLCIGNMPTNENDLFKCIIEASRNYEHFIPNLNNENISIVNYFSSDSIIACIQADSIEDAIEIIQNKYLHEKNPNANKFAQKSYKKAIKKIEETFSLLIYFEKSEDGITKVTNINTLVCEDLNDDKSIFKENCENLSTSIYLAKIASKESYENGKKIIDFFPEKIKKIL